MTGFNQKLIITGTADAQEAEGKLTCNDHANFDRLFSHCEPFQVWCSTVALQPVSREVLHIQPHVPERRGSVSPPLVCELIPGDLEPLPVLRSDGPDLMHKPLPCNSLASLWWCDAREPECCTECNPFCECSPEAGSLGNSKLSGIHLWLFGNTLSFSHKMILWMQLRRSRQNALLSGYEMESDTILFLVGCIKPRK